MTEPIIRPGAFVFDLQSVDKEGAIREIVFRAKIFADISDKERFVKAIFEREKDCCTGVGHGSAIANGKLPEFTESRIAVGVSKKGVDYGSFDGKPVHFLFIVASNAVIQGSYITEMATLAQFVRDDAFHCEILACGSAEEAETKVIQFYSEKRKITQ